MEYSFKDYNKDLMARALGISMPISKKQSIEVCSFIRHKNVLEAKDILQQVIEKKRAVPFKKFNRGVGHKKKIGPGRYPLNSSKEILKLIENVEANAQFKGLNTSRLYIRHLSVKKSPKALHFGRISRRQMKRATIEIVVEERQKK